MHGLGNYVHVGLKLEEGFQAYGQKCSVKSKNSIKETKIKEDLHSV